MKIVITGGPCSGKTTLIDRLRGAGHEVIPEAAREILSEMHAKGQSASNDFVGLQRRIFERQIAREQRADLNGRIYFLDRGWVDNHVYLQYYTGSIPEDLKHAPVKPYGLVIILGRLPLFNDSERREDERTAEFLHQGLFSAYRNAGYKPTLLPAVSIEKRLDIVLNYTRQIKPLEVA